MQQMNQEAYQFAFTRFKHILTSCSEMRLVKIAHSSIRPSQYPRATRRREPSSTRLCTDAPSQVTWASHNRLRRAPCLLRVRCDTAAPFTISPFRDAHATCVPAVIRKDPGPLPERHRRRLSPFAARCWLGSIVPVRNCRGCVAPGFLAIVRHPRRRGRRKPMPQRHAPGVPASGG